MERQMNHKTVAAFLLLILTRPAWSLEPNPMKVADDEKAVAQGCNEFATDLYGRLRAEKAGNLFFSPYSVSVALAMTYAGAKGQTEAQMAKVLRFPFPQAKLHPAFSGLQNHQKPLMFDGEPQPFQLRVVNRLWGQKDFHFLTTFLNVTRENYGAEMGLVDFNQAEQARKTINSWIEDETEQKIQDLLPPGILNADSRLVLTNAIYFKARWEDEFNKRATKDAPFHLSGRQQVMVPTMQRQDRLRYGESDDVQVLELPYVGYQGVSMLILLPKKIDGLTDLEKALTSGKWAVGLTSRRVNVHLPKFTMTSEFDLTAMLSSMGMSLAFSDDADFSGMSTQEPLAISAVIHKAFVDVNEEGTEAAAATAVGMRLGAAMPRPEEPVEFRADHPFVFLIRDDRTGAVLFLGRVANPKE
jgi:serpin B